jgi:hypothetical protein
MKAIMKSARQRAGRLSDHGLIRTFADSPFGLGQLRQHQSEVGSSFDLRHHPDR